MSKGILNVYCCGGTGVNIGSVMESYRSQPTREGFADIVPYYIDTSLSNVKSGVNKEFVYHIEGLDGSGKVRAENHLTIAECTPDMLHRFKPADINIVVGSASGGSGSVIGPVLVSELLARDENVIVALVGSYDSKIEMENTVKTLKSYDAIAQKRGKPVAVMFFSNDKSSHAEVNMSVCTAVNQIAALFSRQNHGMDSADLNNFLGYNRLTSASPRLTSMAITVDARESDHNIIAVATLAKDGQSTSVGQIVDYQCVGYVPSTENLTLTAPVHYTLYEGMIDQLFRDIQKKLSSVEEDARARRRSASPIASGGDLSGATDAGLVL